MKFFLGFYVENENCDLFSCSALPFPLHRCSFTAIFPLDMLKEKLVACTPPLSLVLRFFPPFHRVSAESYQARYQARWWSCFNLLRNIKLASSKSKKSTYHQSSEATKTAANPSGFSSILISLGLFCFWNSFCSARKVPSRLVFCLAYLCQGELSRSCREVFITNEIQSKLMKHEEYQDVDGCSGSCDWDWITSRMPGWFISMKKLKIESS